MKNNKRVSLAKELAQTVRILKTMPSAKRTLVRGIRTFLDNTLVYLFDKRPKRGPLTVGWDVTFRCNANCSFCNTHKLSKATPKEMTTEACLDLIRQMGKAGVLHLSLTGGEPLVRTDLKYSIRLRFIDAA